MPRFHFNFTDARSRTLDEDGTEFGDLNLAYLDAFRAAQEIWAEYLKARRDPRECAFEITDAAGNVLMILPFTEVLESCRRQGTASRRRPNADTAATHRTRQLSLELAEQIRHNEESVRRARAIIERANKGRPGQPTEPAPRR